MAKDGLAQPGMNKNKWITKLPTPLHSTLLYSILLVSLLSLAASNNDEGTNKQTDRQTERQTDKQIVASTG